MARKLFITTFPKITGPGVYNLSVFDINKNDYIRVGVFIDMSLTYERVEDGSSFKEILTSSDYTTFFWSRDEEVDLDISDINCLKDELLTFFKNKVGTPYYEKF